MTPDITASAGEASPPSSGEDARAAFSSRCRAIEEAYEFMLAYAAQGVPNEEGSASGSQIRDFLRKCDAALTGLGEALTNCVRRLGIRSPVPYDAFISADAIVRTIVRMLLTKRRLLEWTTSSEAERTARADLSGFFRSMWIGPARHPRSTMPSNFVTTSSGRRQTRIIPRSPRGRRFPFRP